jgi:hypothetical protein
VESCAVHVDVEAPIGNSAPVEGLQLTVLGIVPPVGMGIAKLTSAPLDDWAGTVIGTGHANCNGSGVGPFGDELQALPSADKEENRKRTAYRRKMNITRGALV